MSLAALEFSEPWLLLTALLALPVYFWSRRATGSIVFSSLQLLPARESWRTRFDWLPDAMLALATLALAIALAGPRAGERLERINRDGIAIMMIVDLSGSMRALDLSSGERERTRLQAVQDVLERFVLGDGELPGRQDDAVGLISFAGYADTASPLTLDHANLAAIARNLEIVTARSEDGTAIGDALGLAVERLRQSNARSRIAILLTDGVNNTGVETPMAAAELARALGIKVYAIGAGTTGRAPVRIDDPFTGQSVLRSVRVEVDEATLQEIARRTGGEYFRAVDAQGLIEVYKAIDRLERSSLSEQRRRQYRELYSFPLVVGLVLALLGWLARGTVLARAAG